MPWEVMLLSEVTDWYRDLDDATATLVTAAVDLLAESGPTLGRPLLDTLRGSKLAHLKELRPGSVGRSEVRILFAFDPRRQAILPHRWRQGRTLERLVRPEHPPG